MRPSFAQAVAAVAAHELRLQALTLRGWVFLAVFLLMGGLFFVLGLQSTGEASLRPALGNLVVALLFCVPLLTMRQLAEEARSGTLELVLTAPVSPGAVVLGKWLAAVAWCTVLLALTGAWAAVLVAFGQPDPVHLATAWFGLWLCAAAFCAVGLFASSVTADPVVAGLGGVLLLLPPWLAGWVTGHLRGFVRGVVDLGDVAWFAGLCVAFMLLAVRALGRRTADTVLATALSVATVAVLAHLAGSVAPRLDLAGSATLSADTRAVLDEAAAMGVRYEITGFTAMHRDEDAWVRDRAVDDLLRDLDGEAHVRAALVDLDADRSTAEALGVRAHGTVVVTARGDRIDLHPRELFATDPAGGLVFVGEAALRGAMARLLSDEPRVLLLLVGHGERRADGTPAGIGRLVDLVRGRGWTVRTMDLLEDGRAADIPPDTDVVAILGPTEVLTPDEDDALARWMWAGGRLLLAVDPDGALPTAAESVGVTVPVGVVRDPVVLYPHAERPLLWWRRHPITTTLMDDGARPVLSRAAPVVPSPGADAAVLLETSAQGWVERGSDGAFTAGEDLPGPVPVVVAVRWGAARAVVAGDVDWLTDALIDVPANGALAVSALRWAAGDEPAVTAAAGGPLARMALSPSQLWWIRVSLLGGLPLSPLVVGFAIRAVRRRR